MVREAQNNRLHNVAYKTNFVRLTILSTNVPAAAGKIAAAGTGGFVLYSVKCYKTYRFIVICEKFGYVFTARMLR